MRDDYPGSAEHRRLLQAIVDHSRDDPRILAVVVFGSVARGDWHPLSDLDLDVVIADGVAIDPVREARALCDALGSIGERGSIILPKRDDEADVVLKSLRQLSIRYHPLALTSPNIVESMRLLWGRIDASAIAAAGSARRSPSGVALDVLAGRCIRYLLEVDVGLQRDQLWLAIRSLQAARDELAELYAAARGAPRGWQAFEATASPELRAKLGATLPSYSADAVATCLRHCIALLADDLDAIALGRVALSAPERGVLASIVRQRGSTNG